MQQQVPVQKVQAKQQQAMQLRQLQVQEQLLLLQQVLQQMKAVQLGWEGRQQLQQRVQLNMAALNTSSRQVWQLQKEQQEQQENLQLLRLLLERGVMPCCSQGKVVPLLLLLVEVVQLMSGKPWVHLQLLLQPLLQMLLLQLLLQLWSLRPNLRLALQKPKGRIKAARQRAAAAARQMQSKLQKMHTSKRCLFVICLKQVQMETLPRSATRRHRLHLLHSTAL
jgi:hypothetical protein